MSHLDSGVRQRPAEKGAALIELALVTLLLVVIMLGTLDFGRVFYTAMVVTNAARAGAIYGARTATLSNDTTGMQDAALAVLSANGLDGSAALCDTTVWPNCATQTCYCASNDGITFTSALCSSDCSGVAGTHRVMMATVTVTRTFSMISPFPGLPSTVKISRGHTARAE